MPEKFEVRQNIRSVKGARLERVYSSPIERMARTAFRDFVANHPGEYFELVKVVHEEECLSYTKQPALPFGPALSAEAIMDLPDGQRVIVQWGRQVFESFVRADGTPAGPGMGNTRESLADSNEWRVWRAPE